MIRAGIAYTVPYGDEDDLSKFRLLLEELLMSSGIRVS